MQNPALAYDYLETLGKERGMKASEVKVGGVYTAKVSEKVVPVRIVREHQSGGWVGKNEVTGKEVRIRSARRLRYPVVPIGPAGAPLPVRSVQTGTDAQVKRLARGIERALDAAEATQAHQGEKKVLAEAGEPLSCKQIVERAFEKGYWQSEGKTPHATVYSAILREIQAKGDEARFRKAARGRFELAR
jgi:hypothetical protein